MTGAASIVSGLKVFTACSIAVTKAEFFSDDLYFAKSKVGDAVCKLADNSACREAREVAA